ncbi:MAG TPA: hypothetical protein PLO23_07745 [Alphaproteobacteria bacterium]|nr:hypothetical protein [Alphaproteobacteria bacterium]
MTDKKADNKERFVKQTASPVCYMDQFPAYFGFNEKNQERDMAALENKKCTEPKPKP